MKALVVSTDIDLYDVAIMKVSLLRGNTVNDLVVYADTSASGEAVISEERRLSTLFFDMISYYLIKLTSARVLAPMNLI